MSAHESPPTSQTSGSARVALGLIVMMLGLILLLKNIDSWWNFEFSVHIWPFILIMLGLARVADPGLDQKRNRRSTRTGWWMLFVGVWGLLSAYELFGLHYGNSWPILVIGAGGMIVWRSLDVPETARVVNGDRQV